MKKKILVKTDDPDHQKIYLMVQGPVDRLVKITPPTLSLSGAPGDVLKAVVTIEPSPKYQFSILGLTQRFGTNVKARLIKPEKKGDPWQVAVTTTSEKVDDIYDVITLKTDSKYKPKLQIRVFAIYQKKMKKS
jgi:hypothetical protein